ncbi:MAG: Lrp/AsnC family transcriptional regulator [Prevotella sp.]|nr:Lrp/AsnC family transcriptional regulator [Prevotella sp.]MDD7461808.1 Lrp/AsnC family transcriptional regulator [Prevotellaceae bacterium]MDY3364879.1 Lrp/AsnC family transcriptional regulator [Prevotella sp.]MDY3851555.1 Lrp/AsnC family transcriptional regulator [Prevotella sp.]
MAEKTTFESLDEKDILILRTLQQNAHLTVKQVAATCHLSITPVFERIKRLEKDGYIKRYITVLDAEKLHRGFVVYCSVKLSHINREVATDFSQRVMDIPEVSECYNISGKFDYLLKVHSPNMKYYQEFVLNVLGTIPHLCTLESTFVMEEIKHNYGIVI